MSTLRRRAEPRRAPAARRAVRGPAGCAPVSSGHAPGSVREAHSPGAGGPARSGSGAPPVLGCGPLASRRPSHGGEQREKRGPRHSSQGPDLVRRAAPSRPICPRLPPNAPLPDALTPRGGASTGRLRGTQTFRPEQAPALASASGAFLREPRSNPDPVRCRRSARRDLALRARPVAPRGRQLPAAEALPAFAASVPRARTLPGAQQVLSEHPRSERMSSEANWRPVGAGGELGVRRRPRASPRAPRLSLGAGPGALRGARGPRGGGAGQRRPCS